jgi:hypothetical protein
VLQLDSSNVEAIASLGAQQVVHAAAIVMTFTMLPRTSITSLPKLTISALVSLVTV